MFSDVPCVISRSTPAIVPLTRRLGNDALKHKVSSLLRGRQTFILQHTGLSETCDALQGQNLIMWHSGGLSSPVSAAVKMIASHILMMGISSGNCIVMICIMVIWYGAVILLICVRICVCLFGNPAIYNEMYDFLIFPVRICTVYLDSQSRAMDYRCSN